MASVSNVVGMGNDALLFEVERLVKADRALGATLLVHLGEVEARKLYLARGFSSMFEYCRSALGMSEAEAYLRMRAANIGRQFPLVLERFGSGGVHLTAIKLLAPHLTQDNHAQLLDRVSGMKKREIEVLVAELAPQPDVPARLRKLPARAVKPAATFDFATVRASAAMTTAAMPPSTAVTTAAMPPSAAMTTSAMPPLDAVTTAAMPASAAVTTAATSASPLASQALSITEPAARAFALQPPRARAVSTPLSPGRFKLELTLGQDAHDQLLVFARDAGQCAFVSPEGRRCSAREFLEVHHHVPFARGGDATVDNLRLSCRAHNQFLAELDYGRGHMREKISEARHAGRASLHGADTF
jgi:hypothetical protein